MTDARARPPLPTRWPAPSEPRPVVFVGAGGIVRDAHAPAYRAAGIPVAGVYDRNAETARRLALDFGIAAVHRSLAGAARTKNAVFDVAVPAGEILGVLRGLPDGAPVLVQKPMGRDLDEAARILELCRAKGMRAAVNFQLRFAPNMLALREWLRRGGAGEVADVEVRVQTHTPWNRWTFLTGIPRLEILYHSIHYLDLLRSLFGEPARVQAIAAPDPRFPGYADTRATIAFVCGRVRCVVHTNHHHAHAGPYRASFLKVEGTHGTAVAKMGVNVDYPKGERDELRIARAGEPFRSVKLPGSWFPMAFAGTMSNLQRHVAGEDPALWTSVEDAIRTMALVEACYRSSAAPGEPVRSRRIRAQRP